MFSYSVDDFFISFNNLFKLIYQTAMVIFTHAAIWWLVTMIRVQYVCTDSFSKIWHLVLSQLNWASRNDIFTEMGGIRVNIILAHIHYFNWVWHLYSHTFCFWDFLLRNYNQEKWFSRYNQHIVNSDSSNPIQLFSKWNI